MMRKYLFLIGLILTTAAAAQPPEAVKASLIPGEVVSVSEKAILVKTKDAQLSVELSPKTEFKRVAPERPNLSAATSAALADIAVGDKVIVSGIFGEDKSKLPARTVYLMSQSDIAKKNANESQRWTTRGISGKVASVNPQTGQIGVEVRGLVGTTHVMINAKDRATFKRYAPNSVKYSEAVTSSLGDIKAGDMLRAVGDKSADGLSFQAEEIVTGAFQTLAGTVKSIDAEKNEIVITNLQTKKDVTIALGSASVMKKFPEEMAQRMVQFQGAGGARSGGQPGQQTPSAQAAGQAVPGGGNPAGGPGRGMGPGGRAGGIDEMLERFPNITAADLKVGDMVAVSSTRDGAIDKISAIKLLAGVEPFIRAAQASGSMQQRPGQQGGGFNIPGLDGFDSP